MREGGWEKHTDNDRTMRGGNRKKCLEAPSEGVSSQQAVIILLGESPRGHQCRDLPEAEIQDKQQTEDAGSEFSLFILPVFASTCTFYQEVCQPVAIECAPPNNWNKKMNNGYEQ